jgi:4-carboxymuconolactone decarboxylase
MPAEATKQGFADGATERLPMPAPNVMNDAQRAAADALINGPRKGVYGPFLPLLRSPQLLDRVAKMGEYLRFESVLDARIRELAICAVARHTSNQFEWLMHAPLALKAGVAQATLDALLAGARPRDISQDEEIALDFTRELLTTHGVSNPTYAQSLERFGEQGVVELTALLGYFAMVCWVMNVARTPAQAGAAAQPLAAFPQ